MIKPKRAIINDENFEDSSNFNEGLTPAEFSTPRRAFNNSNDSEQIDFADLNDNDAVSVNNSFMMDDDQTNIENSETTIETGDVSIEGTGSTVANDYDFPAVFQKSESFFNENEKIPVDSLKKDEKKVLKKAENKHVRKSEGKSKNRLWLKIFLDLVSIVLLTIAAWFLIDYIDELQGPVIESNGEVVIPNLLNMDVEDVYATDDNDFRGNIIGDCENETLNSLDDVCFSAINDTVFYVGDSQGSFKSLRFLKKGEEVLINEKVYNVVKVGTFDKENLPPYLFEPGVVGLAADRDDNTDVLKMDIIMVEEATDE